MIIWAGIKEKRGWPAKSALSAKSATPAKSAAHEPKLVVEMLWHRDKKIQHTTEKQSPFERKWIPQNEEVARRVAKLQKEREEKA